MPGKYGALSLGSPDEKVVYLTFDAGFSNENVVKILDVLKEEEVTGAFFILPGIIKFSTDVVIRMADEGHIVANHTYTHKDMSRITDYDKFMEEITQLEDMYTEYTGRTMSRYLRPPEGSFNEQVLEFAQRSDIPMVFWSFAYADWDSGKQANPEKALDHMLSNVHNGMVLLLHPTSATNAAVMSDFIRQLKADGYRFGTLDELYEYSNNKNNAENFEISTLNLEPYKEQGIVFIDNPQAEKQIALTFDDGPHPVYTEQILDILDEYDIKATFFIVGKNAIECPEVIQKIIDRGHEIGNHTYSHTVLSQSSFSSFISDIKKQAEYLETEFNYKARLFRPPAGCVSAAAIEQVYEMGYNYVLWSWKMDSRDWTHPSVDTLVKTVLNNIRDGDIVLFHDYIYENSPTPAALKIILPKLIEQGYSFATVSDLFYNW